MMHITECFGDSNCSVAYGPMTPCPWRYETLCEEFGEAIGEAAGKAPVVCESCQSYSRIREL